LNHAYNPLKRVLALIPNFSSGLKNLGGCYNSKIRKKPSLFKQTGFLVGFLSDARQITLNKNGPND
jgi:hypothetical protein